MYRSRDLQFEAVHMSPRGDAAPGGREFFAHIREYLTTAKKSTERMTLRKVSFSERVQHFPASIEMFSFIIRPLLVPEVLEQPAGIRVSPEGPGGINESVNLSRDR